LPFTALFSFEAGAAFAAFEAEGFVALLRLSGFPEFAFAGDEPFARVTFPSDLADLDWGIMELDPVCCCGLGWFKEKVGLWG
jgi:hypothetical protein